MAPPTRISLVHRQAYSELDRELLEALCRRPSERIRPLLERFRERAALTRVDGARDQTAKNDVLAPSIPSKG